MRIRNMYIYIIYILYNKRSTHLPRATNVILLYYHTPCHAWGRWYTHKQGENSEPEL